MQHVAGLNHIAIFVSDLEQSKHFYHDLLGLPIVEYGERTAGIPELSGFAGGQTKEYRLEVPAILGFGALEAEPAFSIDLIQWTAPQGKLLEMDINDFPRAHFAFTVLDLDKSFETLEAQGVNFVSPPVVVLPEKGGRKVLWLRDPDGFLLEMVEAVPGWVGAGLK